MCETDERSGGNRRALWTVMVSVLDQMKCISPDRELLTRFPLFLVFTCTLEHFSPPELARRPDTAPSPLPPTVYPLASNSCEQGQETQTGQAASDARTTPNVNKALRGEHLI